MILEYRTLDESRTPDPSGMSDRARVAMGLRPRGSGTIRTKQQRAAQPAAMGQGQQTLTAVGGIITLLNLFGG